MRIYYCIILLILTTFFSSCSKSWLEEKVDLKQAVPSTLVDFQAMLDNFQVINANSTSYYTEIAADGHYYTEGVWNTFKGTVSQNMYTWTDSVQYNNVADWNNAYKAVAYTNTILDEAKKATNIPKSDLDNVTGQALFTRSFLFYSLAQVFSPVYEMENAEKFMGIPLRLSSDISIPITRSSLKETYNQIINDLRLASEMLPQTAAFTTRASKQACNGLLARVYLSMGDYTNAHLYANEYLQSKNQLLHYSNILTTQNYIGANVEIEYFRVYPGFISQITNYLVSQDLLDLYKEGDLRKSIFFRTSTAGTQFKGSYGSTTFDFFSGIATDEIFLIRAECYARRGDFILAMKDLNDLVRTRWAKNPNGTTKYIDQVATNEADALKIIFEERRKELILRNVRWSDLRRLNLDNRFKTTLTRTIGGRTYTLEPNSYNYTFPIPSDVILQTGIPQNPGWE